MSGFRGFSIVPAAALAAGFLLLAGTASAADVCAVYKKHAPADLGLALDKATSVTPDFCQAWSPDRKTTLMLRVSKMGNPALAVAGTRQGAVNSGNGTVADEPGLGAGAWSQRTRNGLEISFAAKGQLVTVMLDRGEGFTDADAARGRAFAKAVAASLP